MRKTKLKKSGGEFTFGIPRLKKMLQEAPDGEWMITLEEWKQARTNLQNAFMHVCFDTYGEERGLTPAEAKFKLKKEYGCNRLFRDPDTGEQCLLIRDTSDYNIEEGATFIDRILKHMEYDCGIIIDPELRKQYKINDITGEMEEI